MYRAPYKAAIWIVLIAFLLSACCIILWGSYDSYTTLSPIIAPSLTAPQRPVDTLPPTYATTVPPSDPTPQPASTFTASPTLKPPATGQTPPLTCIAQSGDSLEVIAIHFGIRPED